MRGENSSSTGEYKVLAVIQARMNSTRLPGKALMKIGEKTLLECVIERSRLAREVERVVLATTEKSEDDPLCEIGKKMGLAVIRGAVDDVLARFLTVLELYPSVAVVRITGDNPLTDPYLLDELIRHFHQGGFDYCQLENSPYGGGTDIYKASKLSEVAGKSDKPRHREHIITYFIDHLGCFKTEPLSLPKVESRPDVKISVDTQEDLDMVRGVMCGLAAFPYSAMTEVIAVWDQIQRDIKN